MATKTKELKELITGKFNARAAELRQEQQRIVEAAWVLSEANKAGYELLAALKQYNEAGLGEIDKTYARGEERFRLNKGDKFEVTDIRLVGIKAKLDALATLAEEAELALALAKAPTLDATVRDLLAKLKEI